MRYKPRPIGDGTPPGSTSIIPAARHARGETADGRVRESPASLRGDLNGRIRALHDKTAAEAHYLSALAAAGDGQTKPTPQEISHVLTVMTGLRRSDVAEVCRRFARADGAMNVEAFVAAMSKAGGGLPKPS